MLEAVRLQAVRSLVQRWVVGLAGARALPRLQLLTALSGVRSVFMDGLDGLGGKVFMGDVGGTFVARYVWLPPPDRWPTPAPPWP